MLLVWALAGVWLVYVVINLGLIVVIRCWPVDIGNGDG